MRPAGHSRRAGEGSSLADASGYEGRRAGFTLIELLIAVTIFLILTTIAVSAVNAFGDGDRVSGSARQVQSFVSGARDRAIFTNQTDAGPRPVGVRLLPDPNLVADLDGDADTPPTPFASTQLLYVQSGGFFPQSIPGGNRKPLPQDRNLFLNFDTGTPPGTITVDGNDFPPGSVIVPTVFNPGTPGQLVPTNQTSEAAIAAQMKNQQINQLFRAGVLGEPVGGNRFLTNVRLSPPGVWRQAIIVSEPPGRGDGAGPAGGGDPVRRAAEGRRRRSTEFNTAAANGTARTQFELRPVPMAGEQPRPLPAGTAIDLLGAARLGGLPGRWVNRDGSLNGRVPLDILFDPSGTVTGPTAAAGLIHLPVVSFEDLDPGSNGGDYPPGTFLPVGYVGDGTDDPAFDGTTYAGPGKVGRRTGRDRQHPNRGRHRRAGGPDGPVRERDPGRGEPERDARRRRRRPAVLRRDRRGDPLMTAPTRPRRPSRPAARSGARRGPVSPPTRPLFGRTMAARSPRISAVMSRPPRAAARPAGRRAGVTLTEVLMSVLVMGIGVVSVATLFPLAVLRGARATQDTAGTVLKQNAEETLDVSRSPSLTPGAFPAQIGGVPTDLNGDGDLDDFGDVAQFARVNRTTGEPYSAGVAAGAMALDPDANGSADLFGPVSLIDAAGAGDWNGDGVPDSFRKFVVDPLGAAVLAGVAGDGASPIVMGSLSDDDTTDPDTFLVDQFGAGLLADPAATAPVWRFAWPFPRETIAAAEAALTFTRTTHGVDDTVSVRDQMIETAFGLVGREGDYGVGVDTVATIARTAGPAGSGDFLTVTFGDDVDPGTLEDFFPQDGTGPPPVGTGRARAVVFSPGERDSAAIPLRRLYDERAVNVVETVGGAETVRLALPRNQFLGLTGMGGAGDVGDLRVRIEQPDRRYSWMLTCQGGGNEGLRTQVAVFFNRALTADDEQIWRSVRALGPAGGGPAYGPDLTVYRMYWSDSEADDVPPPLVEGGVFLLEVGELKWLRVGEVVVEPTAVDPADGDAPDAADRYLEFTLEGGGVSLNESGGGDVLYATFPRGIVDVFPLADRYTFQELD